MKKQGIPILLSITLLFAGFVAGLYVARSHSRNPVVVSVPSSMRVPPQETMLPESEPTSPAPAIVFPIDINHAGKDAFLALPGIGDVLAERIVTYRENTGRFSSVEELLNVEGIGKKRLEEILDLITIGG